MTELIGYQSREDRMGSEVLTLADAWPEAARAAIVGLNPAPTSVEAGHYYQGRVGQSQMRRLADACLFTKSSSKYFEEAALASGVGFTDRTGAPHGRKRKGDRTRRSPEKQGR